MTIRCDITNGTATVTLDGAAAPYRADLLAALEQARAANVTRVILAGTGKTFFAGAGETVPALADVTAAIAALPAIAAINGAALGDGCEIALACRYRVATVAASLGLPGVAHGLLPGGGATQRLPRLIGLAAAAAMISEGKSTRADKAAEIGLVDALSDDPVAAAMAVDAAALPAERPAPKADDEGLAAARSTAKKKMRGMTAPLAAIDLVAQAATLPLAEGLAAERAAHDAAANSDQARALAHVAAADARVAGQSRSLGTAPVEVTQAVVVGGGNMGSSIAYALAQIGVHVTLVEMDAAARDRARDNVGRLYGQAVKRGMMTPEAADKAQADGFAFAIGYDALPPAQIAIEAAFEDMGVKKTIFAALAAGLPDTAVLATNTSYLDVNQIADGIPNPGRLLGMHFFSPAHIMKLLEIVKARATSDQTMATAFRLGERLRKIPVQAGVCDGFIGNRILTRYRQTTDIVMLEGALPWQIDKAMRDFGFAMGPYEVQDLSGLDIAYANRKRLGLKDNPDYRYIPIADRMVEEHKRLGRKTKAGWYDYAEGAAPATSQLVEDLVIETSAQKGVTRKSFDDAEIQARALTAMIEEGTRILEERIAERPADIDLVMIHGYSFPRWRGGLMYHADQIGVSELVSRIERYRAEDPLSWDVPDLLRKLAKDGKTFASLN